MQGAGRVVVAATALFCLFPAVNALAAPKAFFGVHPNVQVAPLTVRDYDQMASGKVGTMRFQLNWNQTEPVMDGSYQWGAIDAIMRSLAVRHIEPRPFIYGTPSWAASSPLAQPRGPKAIAEWKEFLQDLLRRYGRNGSFWQGADVPADPIRVIQLLNEVNSSKYYKPHPDPRSYGRFVKRSSTAMRKVDPKIDIVLAGMFGTPQSTGAIKAWTYLEQLSKVPGISKSFDGVGIHPYASDLRGITYQMEKVMRVLRRDFPDRKSVYVTEIGWGSAPASGKASLNKGLRGQKQMLQKSFRLFLRERGTWHLKGVTWYSWADPSGSSDPCIWCTTSGLNAANEDPKPSWAAFKQFTK